MNITWNDTLSRLRISGVLVAHRVYIKDETDGNAIDRLMQIGEIGNNLLIRHTHSLPIHWSRPLTFNVWVMSDNVGHCIRRDINFKSVSTKNQ
jgi:hypothetical protein